MLTVPQLQHIMPHAHDRAAVYINPLNEAMDKFGINTLNRISYFLAQIAEESTELLQVKELGSGREYEGRKDLGNIIHGDGPRYKGRGLIQITGRDNYHHCGIRLGQDFVGNPSLLEQPQWAAMSAGWFWDSRFLNEYADEGDFLKVTIRINGAIRPSTHLDRRLSYLTTAKEVLKNVYGGPG